MKQTRLSLSLLAACAVIVTSGPLAKADDPKAPAPAVSESTALAAFKKAVLEIKEMKKDADKKDRLAPIITLKQRMVKMREVKTTGLPDDLKTAWEATVAKMEETAEIFKDVPEKKEEILAWAQKKFSDPAVQEKMKKIAKEGKEISDKLKEIAKKHGIEIPE